MSVYAPGPEAASGHPSVAIVARLSQPGGVQSVILSLIKGLNMRGLVPDIVWDTPPNPALLQEKGAQAGFQPVTFPAPSYVIDQAPATAVYILRAANLIRSSELEKPYDFYYIFFNGFIVDDGAPHVRYLSGPPLIPQLETASPGMRGVPFRVLRWVYRSFLRRRYPVYEFHRGSHYVINSEFTAALFEQAHGVRLPVVHPPIDLSDRSFSPGDLARRDTLTYFSRFVPYKRPEMVLSLAERYPSMRVVLMGGVKAQNRPYFDALAAQARQAGLENVFLIANPSGDQVRAELARTRFFVFPGKNEHFGMATAEAIGSGAIPFVHDSGGQREIVPDNRLRFQDEQFFEQFDRLTRLPEATLNQIRLDLNAHVRKFSEEAFIDRMLSFLPEGQRTG